MGAQKKKTAGRATRKKATRKKTARTPAERLRQLAEEVPETVASFSRRVRTGLTRIEREIASGKRDGPLVRTLRDVSHQLGTYEAYGEKGWRGLTLQARHEAAKALNRLERVIEPPKPKPKRRPRRTTKSK
jgi:hypothetical protein